MIEAFAVSVAAVALAVSPAAPVAAAKPLPPKCDEVAILFDAGFDDRATNRLMWSVAWRESHHESLDESSPWFSGALGWLQVQSSAHSGKPGWSRAAMLDRARQARFVFKQITNKGRNFEHYGVGLSKSGKPYMDTTIYSMWGSGQQYAWIWAPFIGAWYDYPVKCFNKVKKGRR